MTTSYDHIWCHKTHYICAEIQLHECVGLFVVMIGREDWKGGREGKEKGRERREGE